MEHRIFKLPDTPAYSLTEKVVLIAGSLLIVLMLSMWASVHVFASTQSIDPVAQRTALNGWINELQDEYKQKERLIDALTLEAEAIHRHATILRQARAQLGGV